MAGETKTGKSKALFLIPCCSRKSQGGDNPSWLNIKDNTSVNKLGFLDRYRRQLIDFYSELDEDKAPDYYKNRGDKFQRPKKVHKAWRKNLGLLNSNTKPAINRYSSGKLYRNLNSRIVDQLNTGAIDNVLIVSALFGIIYPTDLIPDYELMMTDKTSKNQSVSGFWRDTFRNEDVYEKLNRIISSYDYVYCLMSDSSGYLGSVMDIISGTKTFHARFPGAGQNSPSLWGKVLNEALLKGACSPDEVNKIVENYSGIMGEVGHYGIKNTAKKTGGFVRMGLTDGIRKFVCESYIEPARKRSEKEITIRAGDVHSAMGLSSRMPAVCSALKSKLENLCNVEITNIEAPPSGQGANFYVTYRILDNNSMSTLHEPVQEKKPSEPLDELKPGTGDIPDTIRKLSQLKDDGIISEEEFETKKKELLDRL